MQNHIGELWALFEFLSPGLLGRSSAFRRLVGNVRGQDVGMPIDDVRRGLAPFLLRRTKEQVLAELPEKQEQTLFCDLGKPQRRAYDALPPMVDGAAQACAAILRLAGKGAG